MCARACDNLLVWLSPCVSVCLPVHLLIHLNCLRHLNLMNYTAFLLSCQDAKRRCRPDEPIRPYRRYPDMLPLCNPKVRTLLDSSSAASRISAFDFCRQVHANRMRRTSCAPDRLFGQVTKGCSAVDAPALSSILLS